ncbi:MAG: DUF4912 domain-containing protein [Firmicutes bacterium]|nr:DUF4912 domain-containing protein [Bacillota bacterium]
MSHKEKNDLNRGLSLPQYYGEDRLVLLPRDPYCIFAYWELSEPTRGTLAEQVGINHSELSFILRVCKHSRDDENKVEGFFDITVRPEDDRRYIAVPGADRVYHTRLGWRLPPEPFQPLLSSNSVRTPRDCISDLIDEKWQLPDWRAQKLLRRISLHHLSSAEFVRRAKM